MHDLAKCIYLVGLLAAIVLVAFYAVRSMLLIKVI